MGGRKSLPSNFHAHASPGRINECTRPPPPGPPVSPVSCLLAHRLKPAGPAAFPPGAVRLVSG